ncbi:MAG: hypothetical protein K2P93_05630 [Alphaproteobacteria bacterium]|nr:hypothetical protein [Alphaproteobacteria bacterium]
MTLPVMKIYKESFRGVRMNLLEWIRVAYAPLLIWAVGFAFMGFSMWSVGHPMELHHAVMGKMISPEKAGEDWFLVGFANFVYFIAYFVAVFSLYVNGFRYGVLHEGGKTWWNLHLNKRFVKMILYSFLIGILGGVYALLSAGIILLAEYLFASIAVNIVLGTLLALYGFYLMFRITLTFLLIAIDRSEPIRVSWRLLRGNVLRVVGLVLLIMLKILFITLVGLIALVLIGTLFSFLSPWLAGVTAILIYIFMMFIWFYAWAVNAQALSLVYRVFTEGEVSEA